MRRLLLAAVAALAAAALSIAPVAVAENTTGAANGTNTTVNVTEKVVIANVSLPMLPGVFFTASHNGTHVVVTLVYASFLENGGNATVQVAVGVNGSVMQRVITLPGGCEADVCRARFVFRAGMAPAWVWVNVSAPEGSRVYNLTLEPPPTVGSPLLGPVSELIPAAVILGLSVRGDRRAAGMGAIAAGLLVFLMGVAGVAEADPVLVSIPIIVGVLLLVG